MNVLLTLVLKILSVILVSRTLSANGVKMGLLVRRKQEKMSVLRSFCIRMMGRIFVQRKLKKPEK